VQYLLQDPDPPAPRSRPSRRDTARTALGPRLNFLVQVAGLLATGWLMWVTSVSPRLHRYTWSSLAGSALGYAFLALVFGAALTFALYLAVPRRERVDAADLTIRTSTAAVWFAPAIILLTQFSPAALAAAIALVITSTRLLYSEWRRAVPPDEAGEPRPEYAGLMAEVREKPPLFAKEIAPALAVAFCAQSGAVMILMRLPLVAGCFLAAGAALATVFAIASGVLEPESRRPLPQAAFGAILTVLLASGLTMGGLSGRVIHRPDLAWDAPAHKPGLVESLRAMLRHVLYGEQPEALKNQPDAKETQPDEAAKTDPFLQRPGEFPDGSFPGVILLPEPRKVPALVAPVSPHDLTATALKRPIGIPFDGQYWFFRQRYRQPPPNSIRRKGSPATLSFSTTDHWPLEMEAHQLFDEPLDLNCCRTVQLQIWNADRYPGTVRLDFFALESDISSGRSVYVGGAPVRSKPDLTGEHVVAVPETLTIRIPEGALEGCTGFKVIFRRNPSRADKSARIALERFVLVP
jgi:hypothetical protein